VCCQEEIQNSGKLRTTSRGSATGALPKVAAPPAGLADYLCSPVVSFFLYVSEAGKR
jgi:hypothetical protein